MNHPHAFARGTLGGVVFACALAACGGRGDGDDSAAGGGGGGTGSPPGSGELAPGIWSGSLTPSDPDSAPMSGWLVIGADGSFNLDTDAALFQGSSTLGGKSVSVSATSHPYADADDNGSVTFKAAVAGDGTLTGTWSGQGTAGTLQFRREDDVSQQLASLPAIASDYTGELWVRDAMLAAQIGISADGTLHATTSGGCTLDGMVTVRDAGRNGYAWSGTTQGCAVDGTASGIGFLIEDYSLYMNGTVGDAAVWLGGVDSDAPTQSAP